MKLVKFNIKNGQHILVNANSVTSIEKKYKRYYECLLCWL